MRPSALLADARSNWKSGLTVCLVSIPLSISLAVAANATPLMGVLTAVWAGLFAALFGGSNYNIVGPTGALSGILAALAIRYGTEILPMLAVLTGLVILIFYVFRWDQYIMFIPSSVVHGFTLGVACIIALNQLNFALGLRDLPVHEHFLGNVMESLRHAGNADPATIALFLAALGMLFVLLRTAPRMPGAVIVAAIGIMLGYASESGGVPFAFQTLFTKFGTLQMVFAQPPPLTFPPLEKAFVTGVAAVALVAVIETLLSAKIADGMTQTSFKQRREVLGLALANIASGAMGGIPATAALARTALNVKSGASTRMSAGLNAVFVMGICFLLFTQFQYLPLAVVAAILVYVAIRMVEAEHFLHLYRIDKKTFGLSLVVAAITLVEDPIVGILVGTAVSLLMFVRQISKGHSEITVYHQRKLFARVPHHRLEELEHHGDITVYRIAGEFTYLNGKTHAERVKRIRGCHTLILGLRNLYYIDIDGLDTLEEIIEERENAGMQVMLSGVNEYTEPLLRRAAWFRAFEERGRVFKGTSEALTRLGLARAE